MSFTSSSIDLGGRHRDRWSRRRRRGTRCRRRHRRSTAHAPGRPRRATTCAAPRGTRSDRRRRRRVTGVGRPTARARRAPRPRWSAPTRRDRYSASSGVDGGVGQQRLDVVGDRRASRSSDRSIRPSPARWPHASESATHRAASASAVASGVDAGLVRPCAHCRRLRVEQRRRSAANVVERRAPRPSSATSPTTPTRSGASSPQRRGDRDGSPTTTRGASGRRCVTMPPGRRCSVGAHIGRSGAERLGRSGRLRRHATGWLLRSCGRDRRASRSARHRSRRRSGRCPTAAACATRCRSPRTRDGDRPGRRPCRGAAGRCTDGWSVPTSVGPASSPVTRVGVWQAAQPRSANACEPSTTGSVV